MVQSSSASRLDPHEQLAALCGGIIVSCQPGDATNPMAGPDSMARMARAAMIGGAVGIRANGVEDTRAIMDAVPLPVLAINKVDYGDSPVRITPTLADTEAILATGAQFIALDATTRHRPNGESLRASVDAIHAAGALAFGDLATREDLSSALAAGVDAVGTTLSGYTEESATSSDEPDLDLVAYFVTHSSVPVFAEGRYWTPKQASAALEIGASFVVVGTAITNPMKITERFVARTRTAGTR